MQTSGGQSRATRQATKSGAPPRVLSQLPDLDDVIFSSLLALLGLQTTSEIYGEFLRQSRRRLAEFARHPDLPSLHDLAHTLKGSAGMLGAQAIATCAAQLESASYPSPAAERLLAGMRDGCAMLETVLRERQVSV